MIYPTYRIISTLDEESLMIAEIMCLANLDRNPIHRITKIIYGYSSF